MDPKSYLFTVKHDLVTTHDVPNTQIRLFQLSKNPELLLSEGQRGALNFYSSLQDVDESTLVRLIDSIHTPSSMDLSEIQTIQTNVEPIIKSLSAGKYKWYLIQHSLNLMELDPSTYSSAREAQEKADSFMTGLNEGDQKHWIRLAIVQLANNAPHSTLLTQSCQSTILKIHSNYYALITQSMVESMTKEIQEQKTVHFTNKVLTIESHIDPVWVTRGFIPQAKHGVFYILYKLHKLDNITELTKSLKTLLC